MQDSGSKTTRQTDMMDPARAAALCATLGLADSIAVGDALPPFFHQIYFWDPQPPQGLGRDGHPAVGTGGLIPDMGQPRRMWAGGALDFYAPLLAGTQAERRSTVENVARKEGRSGALGFVTLRHEIWQDEALCVSERQDLVYRADPDPDAPRPTPPAARMDEETCEQMSFSSTLLFRYSALTLNGHRIHYDETYARGVEGYDGLVVHGPLLAQLLMLQANRQGPLRQFEFRGSAPLMHTETADLCQKAGGLWIRGGDGRQIMTARARWSA